MLFQTAVYLFATIGVIVVMAVIAFAVAYVILMRRLALKMRDTVEEMETLLSQAVADTDSCVPPLRIHLEPTVKAPSPAGSLNDRIVRWLEAHSFCFVGDFEIEELGHELLQIFLSDDRRLVAAMRYPTDCSEPYVEFCFDLGKGQRGGVGNPPACTLQLPDEAVGKFYHTKLSDDFGILSRMWLDAKELLDQHAVIPVEADQVAEFFEDAHAAEMDCRVIAGGVSEEEIRAAFVAQGVEPTPRDIEELQEQWQTKIDAHILDFSARSLNHHHAGERILIVYDGSTGNYLVKQLRETLEELQSAQLLSPESLRTAFMELRELLNHFPPREAIARFRPLLPDALRYRLVDQVTQPVEADLYLLPKP